MVWVVIRWLLEFEVYLYDFSFLWIVEEWVFSKCLMDKWVLFEMIDWSKKGKLNRIRYIIKWVRKVCYKLLKVF